MRAILEGVVLFSYLADAPLNDESQEAYVLAMHNYDCKKRISILPHISQEQEIEIFKVKSEEIEEKLRVNQVFKNLNARDQRKIIEGKFMMLVPQSSTIERLGIEQADFDFYWNYLSQYSHVLSFTTHRVDADGRGTGVENDTDTAALNMALEVGTKMLTAGTDRMAEIFPDVVNVRKGRDSKFIPGPSRNLPRNYKRRKVATQ